MYKIGSIVVYGTEGLCKICDITERTFGKETSEYYVLSPLAMRKRLFLFLKITKKY